MTVLCSPGGKTPPGDFGLAVQNGTSYNKNKGGDRMKNHKWKTVMLFLCGVLWLITIPKGRDGTEGTSQMVDHGNGWRISFESVDRDAAFWKCDGTDTLVYFCYSQRCVIDAYDYDGNYQFTITLRDSQNGGTSIHCTEDLLYARSKDGTVYVFNGTEMTQTMTAAEATALGCSFSNLKSRIYVSSDTVFRQDEAGSKAALFPVPAEVAENMSYFDYGDRAVKNRIYVGLLLGGFALAALAVIAGGRAQNRKAASKLDPTKN